MTDDQLRQAQAFIIEQFKAVRPRLLAAFGQIDEVIKDDKTPVTALDKEIEVELRAALEKFDPGVGYLGEETGQAGNTGTFWMVDPIDGTEAFIRGLPWSRNMVTLVDNGQPVLAVVYKFITDDLYTVIRGRGAFKNGERLHASQRPLSRSWVELISPLSEPKVFPVVQAVRKLTNGYRVTGDFPLVMEGRIDATLGYLAPGGDWDYAPRALMAQEAGLKVTNLGKDTFDFRNHDFLMANPAIFDELMTAIVQAM